MSRHSSTSLSHALRRMVHATEDLVDDALDRTGDFEHGMRRSLSRALDDAPDDDCHRYRDQWRPRDHTRTHDGSTRPASAPHGRAGIDSEELSTLTHQVAALVDRVEKRWDEDGTGRSHSRDAVAPVPEPRRSDDAEALKEELSQLADRIERLSGGGR